VARFEFKLPDIGEGIAEAEIVAWHVKSATAWRKTSSSPT
jgi:2-oxoisovalerate dehydrogenase E2 component (dihydrolipoyl transacylase)